jgi:hypothetical protein
MNHSTFPPPLLTSPPKSPLRRLPRTRHPLLPIPRSRLPPAPPKIPRTFSLKNQPQIRTMIGSRQKRSRTMASASNPQRSLSYASSALPCTLRALLMHFQRTFSALSIHFLTLSAIDQTSSNPLPPLAIPCDTRTPVSPPTRRAQKRLNWQSAIRNGQSLYPRSAQW